MNQAITAGSTVRISYGKQRGFRGQVQKVDGRFAVVETAAGTDTFLISQLEAV